MSPRAASEAGSHRSAKHGGCPVSELYIGLMSGTSLDGVDGVLADFTAGTAALEVRAHRHRPFPDELRRELLALNAPGADELHRAALAGNGIARAYAEVVRALLQQAGVSASQVRAIGAHGQTVRHRPREFDGVGYTIQLNAPALLAELGNIDVVADLRSRDVAAGGLGAPLVPAFHRAVFGRQDVTVAVLNLGGIANLTLLDADGGTRGFDCGPGNVLMDLWCRQHRAEPYDRGGAWAASGRVIEALLQTLLAEPYFALQPPKATGRDLFNAGWLAQCLSSASAARPEDVQATLAELTAAVCADALRRHGADAGELLVCGGGACNEELMRRLGLRLPGVHVTTTASRGLPVDQVEACAFAWLARRFVEGACGNLEAVTGAAGPRRLGCLYPAR
jgi:anhydro-N-acetylmuramic acid kinase